VTSFIDKKLKVVISTKLKTGTSGYSNGIIARVYSFDLLVFNGTNKGFKFYRFLDL